MTAITYEKAKATAQKYGNFNAAYDYGDAFVFTDKGDQSDNTRMVAVMKKNGKVMPFTEYLLMRQSSGSPQAIPF